MTAFLLSVPTLAQSNLTIENSGELGSKGVVMSEKEMILGVRLDPKSTAIENGNYTDSRMEQMQKDLEREMAERKWNDEDTAWEMASSIDTKDAYKKYIGMHPYGAHRGLADKRIIDIEVRDILMGDHGAFPEMERVQSDDNSPKSVIVVENLTEYVMTVYYSGIDSKRVKIGPGTKCAVVIPNGNYRVAASVPKESVRPYAGNASFNGGRYETGFTIVRRAD